MDRIEMEKLMDKYKREMLEFSRRNSLSDNLDSREKAQADALNNGTEYMRDRENPLPIAQTLSSEVQNEEVMQAQTSPRRVDLQPRDDDDMQTTDVAAMLRASCENISRNPNSTEEQRRRCREINEYLRDNPDSGTIRVEVYASDRAFGIGSARVMMFLTLPSGSVAVFDGLTDISGSTPSIILPAPSRELSQSPNNGGVPPFSTYMVYVEHPSYVRALFNNVPVFSGVESIQPVQMLAKTAGTDEPEPIIIDEVRRNTL